MGLDLAAVAGFLAGAGTASALHVWYAAEQDWSLPRRQMLVAPVVAAVAGLLALLWHWAGPIPAWPAWVLVAVGWVVFVLLPALRGAQWAATWRMLRSRWRKRVPS